MQVSDLFQVPWVSWKTSLINNVPVLMQFKWISRHIIEDRNKMNINQLEIFWLTNLALWICICLWVSWWWRTIGISWFCSVGPTVASRWLIIWHGSNSDRSWWRCDDSTTWSPIVWTARAATAGHYGCYDGNEYAKTKHSTNYATNVKTAIFVIVRTATSWGTI